MLVDEGGFEAVTMAAVARVAKVSRQAVYLHFADRSELLVALVDRIDMESEVEVGIAAVHGAPTAENAVEEWARMQVWHCPRVAAAARQVDAMRHSDEAGMTAWRNRLDKRMLGARALVERLANEGKVHQDWSQDDAALLLWELMSFRVWDDLVNDGQLATERYVRLVTSAALSTLREPPFEPKKRRRAR
jgi:AcrR family transcriptional regulator